MLQFLILAPDPTSVKARTPLSYWTEHYVSSAQHLAVRHGADLVTCFRAICIDNTSESYHDVHNEPCIGAPFTGTIGTPIKILMAHAGTTQAAKGVVMFVATKVMDECEDDCDNIDFHFDEGEGRSRVCQTNQVPNAPFSEDPAAVVLPTIV